MNRKNKIDDFTSPEHLLARGDELNPDVFPCLETLSPAWIYRFLPIPAEKKIPEYVYIDLDEDHRERNLERIVWLFSWNLAWQAGQYRPDIAEEKIPKGMEFVKNRTDVNIHLIPYYRGEDHHFGAYEGLFSLLPLRILRRHNLPAIRKTSWPQLIRLRWNPDLLNILLGSEFDTRLSQAFAEHLWPFLNSRSYINKFSDSDPIKILAHHLNFWLPYLDLIIQKRLGKNLIPPEDDEQLRLFDELSKMASDHGDSISRPAYGGYAWIGEEEAIRTTLELIELADEGGNLRSILDAVRSNRIADDFSTRWSYEREDFERKLYRKRSRIKVAFVELPETLSVHSPESEVHENLLWEGFFSLINTKERQVVVCLRNGVTKLTDIAKAMNYANHSPISKMLRRIRKKAMKYLQ